MSRAQERSVFIDVVGKSQMATGTLKRFIALSCIFMALVMTGLEARHVHSDAASSSKSHPCAICISVHANAPAVTFHPLPVLFVVDVVAITFQSEGKSTAPDLQLFIRPPPSV
jgi:hypothetical protein